MVKELMEQIKKENIEFAEMQFTDLHGTIKTLSIPADKSEKALEQGIWFDGSSIEGFTRICESDMYLKPDLETYAVIPWLQSHKTCRLLCDVFNPDGKPFEGDPRHILKNAVEKAREKGFEYMAGPEIEFFLFKENGKELHDSGGYFDFAPKDNATGFKNELVGHLKKLGISVEMTHHECAPSQHEVDFEYSKALISADRTVTLKYALKSIASLHEMIATFMPKPLYGVNGSGMHVHQSLFDLSGKKNLFFDSNDRYSLSKTAKHFIAGQLEHARALAAITNPTVNSYKRLVPDFEAPCYVCWARTNRSALIRIPQSFKNSDESTRAEIRSPDPSANPYLAFAAMLIAGLDGIERKLEPPEPVEENVYLLNKKDLEKNNISVLPSSLREALDELKKDKVVLGALGGIAKPYLKAKKREWHEYRTQVTEWEKEKYFDTA